MDGDLDAPEDERATELSSIAAIFPELIINPSAPFSATIDLPVELAEPIAVFFQPLAGGAPPVGLPTPPTSEKSKTIPKPLASVSEEFPTEQPTQETHYLLHFPPLTLHIDLPDSYPAQSPPTFSLSTKTSWLSKSTLQVLEGYGPKLWRDLGGSMIVFDYIDYLQRAAESGFRTDNGEPSPLTLSHELKIPLMDFDLRAKRAKFEQETYDCGICLEPKKGFICHRLTDCSHVFCVACLQDFYNACITEGDVSSVKCLDPECGKAARPGASLGQNNVPQRRRRKDATLSPSELQQIPLDQEIVQRYVKLKRKKKLESDKNTVWCPRQWCQGPARSKKTERADDTDDSESEAEASERPTYNAEIDGGKLPPPSERLAICNDCAFAFCLVCKAGWHGEFAPCFPRKKGELTAEEKASEDYMKLHTTPCPTCDARVQKTQGCNHMICFKCNSHFCYLCSAWLEPSNPYIHFNSRGPCYMRLWELEAGDGAGPGEGYEGGRAIEDLIEDDSDVDEEEPEPELPPAPLRAPLRPEPAPRDANRVRANQRVQQGLVRPAPLPRLNGVEPPVQGLQRFLELAVNDEEDEWDSDEDDDDDVMWEIPVR